MRVDDKNFNYVTAIRLKVVGMDFSEVTTEYPGISTINFESRTFLSYDECVSSARRFMDIVTEKSNVGSTEFTVGTEVNPALTGVSSISKDWQLGEVARLWVYKQEMEKTGQIHAIAQTKIFSIERTEYPTLN